MTTDYATELLGRGSAPAAAPSAPAGVDYASDLLGATAAPSPFAQTKGGAVTGFGGTERSVPQASSFDQLPIANRDTHKGTASFLTLSKAAMVDDPATKLKIFAKARFPKLSDEEAASRYGMVDGQVVYVGDDNKLYRETPGQIGGNLKRLAAGVVGAPGATIGGTVGAIAGAPGGPGTAAGLSALGAAGGKGLDRAAANLIFDEPQTSGGNLASMATEGAFAGGFSVLGSALGKFMERNLARDIGRLDEGATKNLTDKANAIGVDLNPAQATNLPSLKAKVDVLHTMPTSRDTMAAGATTQAGQASAAVTKFLNQVSPREGLDEAGTAARDAAGAVIDGLVKERAAKASPLYKAAFENFKGVPQELLANAKSLMSRPAMSEAGKKAVILAKNEGIDLADPTNSLLGMHYMKMALDDMIEGAGQQGLGGTYRRGVVNLKNQLLEVMDKVSPEYKQAREVFAHFSPNVNSVREGAVSKLANLGDEATHKAANQIFGGNLSPQTVSRTRDLFIKAGKTEDWDTLVRAHLQSAWEKAGKEFASGSGGAAVQAPKWRAALWGDQSQRRILEAAMEPGQKAALNDMMDVFEAMGRTAYAGQGSQTAGRMEGARLMREEAGSSLASKGAQLLSPQSYGTRISAWLDEVRLGKHTEKLAEIMTSPNGMKQLRELKKLAPNDKKFIQGAASLFGVSIAPDGVGASSDTGQGAAR